MTRYKYVYFVLSFQVGLPVRDVKRQAATSGLKDMNVAQLQVLVNDLHTQIESESYPTFYL